FDHPAVGLAKELAFSAFLRAPLIRAGMQNSPYGRYVQDADGVERADLFIRLEHLAEDLAPLEAHLGFALGAVSQENRSERNRDWRVYYGDDEAAIVAEACAEDIARFSYRFG
ncbi:MAG: Type II secretory pathway, pullulanase PulA, partial [Maritimibacter sp.]